MSQHDAVTIRCWQLTGETALEDMVLGVDERAVRDGINVLSLIRRFRCLSGHRGLSHGAQFLCAPLPGGGALQG